MNIPVVGTVPTRTAIVQRLPELGHEVNVWNRAVENVYYWIAQQKRHG